MRDNETWVEHLGEGNSNQENALLDLRLLLLRNLSRALTKSYNVNESFIEDAIQDSLILILKRLSQFEGRSQFLTWATSISIRVAMSKLRRMQWKDVPLEDEMLDAINPHEMFNENHSEPELDWEKKSLLNKMYNLIQNDLTKKQRIALLAELKGMPQDEIARRLGSNRNAVYKLTHDARKRLKQSLEIAGYEIADVYAAFNN